MTQPPQANGEDMIAATDPDDPPPPRCEHCGADAFGCQIKLGLGGRRCENCGHVETRKTAPRRRPEVTP